MSSFKKLLVAEAAEKKITLYHATNKSSAKKCLKMVWV